MVSKIKMTVRLINLIHGIAKFIIKIKFYQLAPFMNSLVSNAESPFIKKPNMCGTMLGNFNDQTRHA
jgi:hypothetical protein